MAPSSSPSPSKKLLINGPKLKTKPAAPPHSGSGASVPAASTVSPTLDQPNLSDCQCCGYRVNHANPKDRLELLDSIWRIVLLCRACGKDIHSGHKCPYCFRQTGNSGNFFQCSACERKIHEDCIKDCGDCPPWCYLGAPLEGFRVCVDCWVPELLKNSFSVCEKTESEGGLKDDGEAKDFLGSEAKDAKRGVEKVNKVGNARGRRARNPVDMANLVLALPAANDKGNVRVENSHGLPKAVKPHGVADSTKGEKSNRAAAGAKVEKSKSATDSAKVLKSNSTAANAKAEKSKITAANAKAEKSNSAAAIAKVEKSNVTVANAKAEKSNITAANAKAEKSNITAANAKAEKSNIPAANAKAEKSNISAANAMAEKSSITAANAKAEKSGIPAANAKAEKSNIVTANAKAEKSNIAAANAKAENSNIAAANAKAENTNIAAANAKAEKSNIVVADARAEKSNSIAVSAKTEKLNSAADSVKVEKSNNAAASAMAEKSTSATDSAKAEKCNSVTAGARAEKLNWAADVISAEILNRVAEIIRGENLICAADGVRAEKSKCAADVMWVEVSNDAAGGVKAENSNSAAIEIVDDAELAIQLHRAMNSSPRICRSKRLVDSNSLDVLSSRIHNGLAYKRSWLGRSCGGDQKLEAHANNADSERMNQPRSDQCSDVNGINPSLLPYKRDRKRKVWQLNDEEIVASKSRSNRPANINASLHSDDASTRSQMKSRSEISGGSLGVNADQNNLCTDGNGFRQEFLGYSCTQFKLKACQVNCQASVSAECGSFDNNVVPSKSDGFQLADARFGTGFLGKSNTSGMFGAEGDCYNLKHSKRVTGTQSDTTFMCSGTFESENQANALALGNSAAGCPEKCGEELTLPNQTCNRDVDRYCFKYAKRMKGPKPGSMFESRLATGLAANCSAESRAMSNVSFDSFTNNKPK